MKTKKKESNWCPDVFLLFPLFSLMFPLMAQGESWYYAIGPCDKDIVVDNMSINKTTGKHSYAFKGKCLRYKMIQSENLQTPVDEMSVNVGMTWSFDPATGVLKELMTPASGPGFLSVTYNCTPYAEGLRFHSCSKIGDTANSGVVGFGGYKPYWYNPSYPRGMIRYPITRSTNATDAIKDYLRQKEYSLPAPIIISPEVGKEYPMSELLPIGI
ncbi:MAG: hypothetical protein OEQ18_01155, partial [Gammaproteobacteria bacterium]|nr:hypothetical protein [Gammaproteobacteria bacterium]